MPKAAPPSLHVVRYGKVQAYKSMCCRCICSCASVAQDRCYAPVCRQQIPIHLLISSTSKAPVTEHSCGCRVPCSSLNLASIIIQVPLESYPKQHHQHICPAVSHDVDKRGPSPQLLDCSKTSPHTLPARRPSSDTVCTQTHSGKTKTKHHVHRSQPTKVQACSS